MIARVWRGIALPERIGAYLAHLEHTVFPELSRIEGYRGAYVLQRELDEGVEITVQTLWISMEAIRRFAGEDVSAAVVAPAAQPLFRSYDATVTHFQADGRTQAAGASPFPRNGGRMSVEHQPFAEEESHVLLIEASGTPNTGDPATPAPRRAI